MNRIVLLIETIMYMNFKQFSFQILSRIRTTWNKTFNKRRRFNLYKEGAAVSLDRVIPKFESCKGDMMTFINVTDAFSGWENRTQSALWNFNLNYMDFLLQPSMNVHEGKKWIMRFIESQHCNNTGVASYCVSLRCVNWIKFVSFNITEFSEEEKRTVDASLYSQYRLLASNIEYHLGGNHLLEDFFALVWLSVYFKDAKMYRKSSGLLMKELKKQTLADGANFEQSPMYHCIILERQLDLINLLKNNDILSQQIILYTFLSELVSKMLGWIKSISYSDGSYPLFNDSANCIAPSLDDIYDYASLLGVEASNMDLKESGYRAVNTRKYELRIDIANVKASYIPGHTHADTFNFEMRIGAEPFIIDTGISTYDVCERRLYERSTSAHNTVVVNDSNSSGVWSSFRCGRRAKVFDVSEGENYITASHDGYKKQGVVHTRRFEWSDSCVVIYDYISGNACSTAMLHFAKDVDISIKENVVFTSKGIIELEGHEFIEISDGYSSEAYNEFNECKILSVRFKERLVTKIVL